MTWRNLTESVKVATHILLQSGHFWFSPRIAGSIMQPAFFNHRGTERRGDHGGGINLGGNSKTPPFKAHSIKNLLCDLCLLRDSVVKAGGIGSKADGEPISPRAKLRQGYHLPMAAETATTVCSPRRMSLLPTEVCGNRASRQVEFPEKSGRTACSGMPISPTQSLPPQGSM